MALNKQVNTNTTYATPDFEEGEGFEEGQAVMSAEEAEAAVEAAVSAPVAASAPVVVPAAVQAAVTQVATAVPSIVLHTLKNKIPLESAKRIASAGGFAAGAIKFGDRNKSLEFGSWITFTPISFYEQYFVTPAKGSTLDEEDRKLQIFGLDPVVSDNGVNYDDYVAELKANGNKLASKEKRLVLLCYVSDAEKRVGALEQSKKQPVLFYLPLTSLNSFNTLAVRQEVELGIGMSEPVTLLRAKAEAFKNKQNKSYSALVFEFA